MAAVSATFVTCRATGAGAKAARASNGAAARAPVAMTSKTNGVSLGARQGSRVASADDDVVVIVFVRVVVVSRAVVRERVHVGGILGPHHGRAMGRGVDIRA